MQLYVCTESYTWCGCLSTFSSNCSWHAGAAFGNGHQSSSVSRDPNSMKAQINGILHEDSLPFYDQVGPPSAPSRQSSASLPHLPGHSLTTQNSSPRLRMSQMQHGTGPTRLSTQGSQIDLGDLGVSSPSGQMSRANSKDTGHIATVAPTQYASGSWQGRLSRVSMDSQQPQSHRQNMQAHLAPAQRNSAPQGSAYASLESMLSSIPETLSGMPSMPSVPSMSDLEKSMQSGWSSFTGSLGLSLSLSPAQPHQQPAAPAGWVAFADDVSTLPASTAPAEASARGMPFTSQPAQPSNTVASQQDSVLLPGSSSGFPPSSVSVRAADGDAGSTGGHTPLASPRKKPTGLQALDPLTAVKEAASVPLRSMASLRQDSSGPSSLKAKSGLLATQASTNRGSGVAAYAEEASIPATDVCPSSDWSEFAAAQAADPAAMQPLPREVTQASNAVQSIDSRTGTDVWAQWSMPANVQAQPNSAARDTSNVSVASAAAADHHSLLDM